MNRAEILEILKNINNAYPTYFKDKDTRQKNQIVNLWLESFKDDSYDLVQDKVNKWIELNKFAPRIVDIKKPPQVKKGFNNYTEVMTDYDKKIINETFRKYAHKYLDEYKDNQQKVDAVYYKYKGGYSES